MNIEFTGEEMMLAYRCGRADQMSKVLSGIEPLDAPDWLKSYIENRLKYMAYRDKIEALIAENKKFFNFIKC
jgi:hypothetical protein